MKKYKNKIMHILQWTLGCLVAGVMILFVAGEMILPPEDEIAVGECTFFESEWVRIMPDQTIKVVTIPGNCEAKRGEWVIIQTVLPDDIGDTWLCMRSSQQDMRIYVGDELRQEYSTKESRLFGKNSESAYVFLQIHQEDAGRVLRIESVSDSSYSGIMNAIYMGEKSDIWGMLLKRYAPETILSVLLLLLSLMVVLYSILIHIFYKKSMEIMYLGMGLFLSAAWLFTNSRLRQFLLSNHSIAGSVGFIVIMLLPYPFLTYLNRVQKRRYQNVYIVIAIASILNFVISFTLQVANIKDFLETMTVSHLLIGVSIVVVIVTMLLDIRNGYIGEYRESAFGFLGMMIAGIIEIYIGYQKTSHYSGFALCIGMVFLLFTAGMKTGSDILKSEREKQMAVVEAQSKAQFLAGMSHEIRTPINTILGMNEMILRENQDETVRGYAENIQSAGKLLLGLINDVLDFSKMEAGKMEIIEAQYEPSVMLREVITAISAKTDEKGLRFETNIAEDIPPFLYGDEIRIKQILNNLLSNAVKYTEKGTITLTVRGTQSGENLLLWMSVEDSGIGIREEEVGKLFDGFVRLDEKKNRNIQGTGLGLSITKQLVDQMNGSIEVQSEYGKGSCFTVQIPQGISDEKNTIEQKESVKTEDSVTKSDKPDKVSESKQADTKAGHKAFLHAPDAHILVVDDNETNLAVIKALLKRTQIKVDTAGGGRECLQMCEKQVYDLIFMDHMMPDPDGIETLHLLRADKNSPNVNTTVIVLTANAIKGVSEQYIKEGFSDYLSKPIAWEKLEEMLTRYLPDGKVAEKAQKEELDMSPENNENTSDRQEQSGEDLTVIDRDMGLMYSGDSEEIYLEILETYYRQGEKYLKELTDCYEKKDWKQYGVIAHAIKSTSMSIGAKAFSNLAKQHEMAAKEGNEAWIAESFEYFMESYRRILEQVIEK